MEVTEMGPVFCQFAGSLNVAHGLLGLGLTAHREAQSDFDRFPSDTPIVIDNGGSTFRIGITFRNVVQRPRHKATGETVTIVGDHDPELMKYFDCTRSSYRSPFDNNVVYQFEIMEYILDHGFERMGANSQVDHPILITECACNPVSSRSKMSELLFETYAIPAVAFGIDAAFSYKYNQGLGICNEDGLAINSGLTTSHVIPVCPTRSRITWEKAEELKMEHCYVALDYASELKLFQNGAKEAEDKTRCWQLPWIPPPQEEAPSEEEIARKAAIKEKQGQRLREMAAARRISKISELEQQVHDSGFLLQQLERVQEHEISAFLSATGYISKQDVESSYVKATESLKRLKGDTAEAEEKIDDELYEKYPLLNVPDNMLTPDQLKEKKKQIFVKTASEGRQKAKQKRFEEGLQREMQHLQEEEKRRENPELYLEHLHVKYRELSEKLDQQKRLKTNGTHTNGNSGGVGRGERLNAAQKERMRLLATAAFDRGKGEDTFGAKDEDWQLYKLMSKDNEEDDEGVDEDEAELARTAARLQELDPTFVPRSDTSPFQPLTELSRLRPLTAEDFQIILGIERFRCPEILFEPNMVGIDQAGLDEMAGISFRRLTTNDEGLKDRISSSILITGGSCLFPGMDVRLESGIRKVRPYLSPIRVVRASDPVLDAWRGASAFAAGALFGGQTFTREDYYEKGEYWLRQYRLTYGL
ncbi:Actin-related protein 5 [Acorus calamus]|uniref:Actin-related protein 5 n=1 Tax=Acorus calamus TaxID=4465 RepID=A0AAV9DDC7_ACOCL|nr:Actin-related protein 5 [Acorus calamus]